MKTFQKYLFLLALIYLGLVMASSVFAPILTPYNPLNIAEIELSNAQKPPFWQDGGSFEFILGTDTQGRDIFSTLLYSMRISIFIAMAAVFFSMLIGVMLGLLGGYFGGYIDTIIMRIVDIKLALPAILIAMLVGGIMRNVFDVSSVAVSISIIVVALTIATWSIYTRAIRSIVIREIQKEYISAAKLMGLSDFKIIIMHIFPNVRAMLGVIMIIDFANCIMLEATLSFLGLGLPPTIPSLGTTIRVGTDYFLSGSWWIVAFPALTLVLIIYSINLVKDYLQE